MSAIIKGYEVHEKLGFGTFGEVYRATSPPPLYAEVAIKFIKPEYASQPDFIRRFESEATMVANLQCPYITPITNYRRDPDGAYIVMWYIRGGNLKESLKNGPFNVHRASRILNQISAALSYAHRNGVIHRDVKPANILLDEEGNAYLSDFGIAKNLQQPGGHTHTGEFVGTVGYTAPEQIRGEAVFPATDVYSLGVILYEMLAGEHPFPKLNQVEQIYKSLNDAVPLLDSLDESIQDNVNAIIQKATEKDPSKRYQDALEMAADFREALASVTGTSPATIIESLTLREHEILKLIIERKSNREIATELFITLGTVKWHVNQIYKKLRVRNRVEAIIKAREMNLIVDDITSEDGNGYTGHTYIFLEEPDNPYKGLSAFTLADERDFYGRDAITRKLLNRMRQETAYHRFLTIIGPSGSGKSSLVKAGLVPAVLRGELEGSEHWFVIDMLPGAHPIDELEVALMRVAADQAHSIGEQIRRDERGLVRVAQLLLPDDGSELLIVIDQFEEVFTLVEDENARQQFLDLIYTTVTDSRSRVRIVATLRADFYDRPLQYPRIGDLIRERMETILPLTAEELEQAIIKPAANVGVRYEEGVVARIISDINYQPGALPLLQFAMTELFENRHNRTITGEAYQEIGGTIGALAKRADELFLSLNEDGQAAARQMFLRLVTLGEGTDDTRRRVAREELLSVSDNVDLMDDVIDVFASYRLLALDYDPITHLPTVEVAHEAILREWEMLRGWLNSSRDDIKQQRELSTLSAEWETHHRSIDFLARGGRLNQLEVWSQGTILTLTPAEKAFLDASVADRNRREREKQAQIERETNLQQRARRILQGLVAVLLIAAIISGGFAVEADGQRKTAEDERDRAERAEQEALRQASIGLAGQAVAELDSDTPDRGVLLALEALEHYPYTPQAERALAQTVRATRPYSDLTGYIATVRAMSFSVDGTLVTVSPEHDAMVWDIRLGQGKVIGSSYPKADERIGHIDVDWSPDGRRFAIVAASSITGAGIDAGSIKVWDFANEKILASWLAHDGNDIWTVDWSSDSEFIVTGGADKLVRIWNATTYEEMQSLPGHTGIIQAVALSPDDSRLASASSDTTIRIWDTQSGETLKVLSGHLDTVNAINWSPDGTHIISGGNDGLTIIWDATTGEIVRTLVGHMGAVLDADWSPDGILVATASEDGTTRVWDVLSGSVISTFIGNSRALAWSPDGATLVVGFGASGLRAWDMSERPLRLVGHVDATTDARWTPDLTRIVSSSFDGTARVWDARSGENTLVFRNHLVEDANPLVSEIHFSSDSQWVVTMGGDNNTRVWNVESGEERFVFAIFGANAFSPDGSKLIIFGERQALVVDWATGNILLEFDPGFEDFCYFLRLSWSPDGRYVATPCTVQGQVDIWDVQTGKHERTISTYDGWVMPTGWSPDGKRLLTADASGVVHIWNPWNGELLFEFKGHTAAVWDAEWSPDSRLIASADETGSISIWNADTGQEVNRMNVNISPLNLSWSPEGTHLIVVGFGRPIPEILRVWTSTDDLIAHAYECCVTRELTPEERQQFGLPERD